MVRRGRRRPRLGSRARPPHGTTLRAGRVRSFLLAAELHGGSRASAADPPRSARLGHTHGGGPGRHLSDSESRRVIGGVGPAAWRPALDGPPVLGRPASRGRPPSRCALRRSARGHASGGGRLHAEPARPFRRNRDRPRRTHRTGLLRRPPHVAMGSGHHVRDGPARPPAALSGRCPTPGHDRYGRRDDDAGLPSGWAERPGGMARKPAAPVRQHAAATFRYPAGARSGPPLRAGDRPSSRRLAMAPLHGPGSIRSLCLVSLLGPGSTHLVRNALGRFGRRCPRPLVGVSRGTRALRSRRRWRRSMAGSLSGATVAGDLRARCARGGEVATCPSASSGSGRAPSGVHSVRRPKLATRYRRRPTPRGSTRRRECGGEFRRPSCVGKLLGRLPNGAPDRRVPAVGYATHHRTASRLGHGSEIGEPCCLSPAPRRRRGARPPPRCGGTWHDPHDLRAGRGPLPTVRD